MNCGGKSLVLCSVFIRDTGKGKALADIVRQARLACNVGSFDTPRLALWYAQVAAQLEALPYTHILSSAAIGRKWTRNAVKDICLLIDAVRLQWPHRFALEFGALNAAMPWACARKHISRDLLAASAKVVPRCWGPPEADVPLINTNGGTAAAAVHAGAAAAAYAKVMRIVAELNPALGELGNALGVKSAAAAVVCKPLKLARPQPRPATRHTVGGSGPQVPAATVEQA